MIPEGATPGLPWAKKGFPSKKQLKESRKLFAGIKDAAKSVPQLMAIFSIMEKIGSSSVVQIIGDFFNLFWDGLEKGLGDAAMQLAESLFTEENIERMMRLGEIVSKLIEKGLIPTIELLEKADPLLDPILNFLERLLDLGNQFPTVIQGLNALIDNLDNIGQMFENAGSSWIRTWRDAMDEWEDLWDDFADELEDFWD